MFIAENVESLLPDSDDASVRWRGIMGRVIDAEDLLSFCLEYVSSVSRVGVSGLDVLTRSSGGTSSPRDGTFLDRSPGNAIKGDATELASLVLLDGLLLGEAWCDLDVRLRFEGLSFISPSIDGSSS